MKKILSEITIVVVLIVVGTVQGFAHRNFYNRIEFGAGNAWTFVLMEGLSMTLNQITDKPLSEATCRFGVPCSEFGNLNSYQGFDDWNRDRFVDISEDEEYGDDGAISLHGRNLFSNIIVGDKAGYISDNLGFWNYCVYGAAYYNLTQYKVMENEVDYIPVNTQRVQLGGGAMLILGSIESRGRFIIDGGLRYNIPVYFGGKDMEESASDMLGKGISSHYMFKYSYQNSIAVGFTFDVMHYNIFKDSSLVGDTSKMFEFGITLSLLFR